MANWFDRIRSLFSSNARKNHSYKTNSTQTQNLPALVNDRESATAFVEKLSTLGYFSYTNPDSFEQAKENLVDSLTYGDLFPRTDNGNSIDKRIYQTDAENLSEGIAYAIELMVPFLKQQGIQISEVKDLWDEQYVHLLIDHKEYIIYDWPNQEPEDLDTWGLAHKRLVEIVNELLVAAKASERLYGLGWGNDASVIFLDEELYRFIRSTNMIMINEELLPKSSEEMLLVHEVE